MFVNFRQGLIGFQQNFGSPAFLQPSQTAGFISQIISPTPTLATFAHRTSDYLVKFESTVLDAWQVSAPNTYLYWDIDLLTAQVSRGTTVLPPITGQNPPLSPVNDQHWFDSSQSVMKVWNVSKNKWVEKVRLFAGQVDAGNIVSSTLGTQVGMNTSSNPGYILLDILLQPIRKNSQTSEFLTAGDEVRVLTSAGTSGVLVQPLNHAMQARSAESIPRMSVVYFSANDTVKLGSSNSDMARRPVGIMVDAVPMGEVGLLVTSGEIVYDQWSWSTPGAALYADSTGQLTLTRPASLLAYRVGVIKNAITVLLDVDSETDPFANVINPNVKAPPFFVSTISGTSATLGSCANHHTVFRFTSDSAISVSIPADSAWTGTQSYWENGGSPQNPGPMPIGGMMMIARRGLGDITISPSGATINSQETLTLLESGSEVFLVKVAANTWDVLHGTDPVIPLGYKSLIQTAYSGSSVVTGANNGKSHSKSDATPVLVPSTLPVNFLCSIVNKHDTQSMTVSFNGGVQAFIQGKSTSATSYSLAPNSILHITRVDSSKWFVSGNAT